MLPQQVHSYNLQSELPIHEVGTNRYKHCIHDTSGCHEEIQGHRRLEPHYTRRQSKQSGELEAYLSIGFEVRQEGNQLRLVYRQCDIAGCDCILIHRDWFVSI